MSILSALLGKQNPAAMWAAQNRGWLGSVGAGLASGPTFEQGLANAAQMGPQGQRVDDAYRVAEAAKAERQQQINKTMEAVQQWPDLVKLLEAGNDTAPILSEAFKRMTPGYGAAAQPDPFTLGPGQIRYAPDGTVIASVPDQPKTPTLPTSYQEYLLGQRDPAYAAGLNSSTSKPPTEGQRRNTQLATVAKPLLKTVEDNWSALTDPKNQAIGANTPLGAPGFALTSPQFQQAQNAIRTIAQSYLYSVSGAAATDAETQKIVDSVTPKFGESEQSTTTKKELLRRMVESIEAAGGAAPPGAAPASPAAPANVDDILTKYGI